MRAARRAFTLVEVMIVVAIVGVLAALAVYGVRRYLASSRTAEAKQNVGAMSRAVVSSFDSESSVGATAEVVSEGSAGQPMAAQLCDSAQPVPLTVPTAKYQPDTAEGADFQTGDALTGWRCIGFQVLHPMYFQYEYISDAGYDNTLTVPTGTSGFQAIARGDLDDDGVFSRFGRTGQINASTGALIVNTNVEVVAEGE